MSAPAILAPEVERQAGVSPAAVPELALTTVEIDASCRVPLMWLFFSAVIWLVLGLVAQLVTSIQLHAPGLLAGIPWLTFGRLRPVSTNAFLYGFASQACIGVLLWIFCRLGGTRLLFPVLLSIALALWNLAVTLGVLGILAGGSTGFQWLEMPSFTFAILFCAYTLMGICALGQFYFRREGPLYVSQWFLLLALFWFPWIYSAASLLLSFFPVRGVVQSIVNAWFVGNFLGLWLTPIALGTIFYFIPKLTGRALYSHYLAAFGFWTLAFIAPWAGMANLLGGPVPAWLASTGTAANLLLLVPILCAGLNWWQTLRGAPVDYRTNSTLRFILVAAGSYLVANLLGVMLAIRQVSAFTHLTYLEGAQVKLALFGFVAMALLGGVRYIVPRILHGPWPSEKRVLAHFWCSSAGIALVFVALLLGGAFQAFALSQAATPFIHAVRGTVPFIGLSTLGELLLLAGQLLLLWDFTLLLRQRWAPLQQAASDWAMEGGS
jgi:cytochrome c oxidase cbb3-type subunit 1